MSNLIQIAQHNWARFLATGALLWVIDPPKREPDIIRETLQPNLRRVIYITFELFNDKLML
jgi:hypothetical protein